MAGRRGNGEGCIRKKKSGRWEALMSNGYDKTGKPKTKYLSAKTRQEVIRKVDDFKVAKHTGTYIEFNNLTVGGWLDTFYETYVVGKVKISTRVNDESIIKHHLKPYIGRIKLTELKGFQVQKFYNQMLIDGRVDGKGGLNPKTIRNIHLTLHKALEQAVKNDLLVKNPLKSVILPRQEKKQIQILTPEEQRSLNKVCFEHPWGMAVLLTLYSGMRMGELLGLTWDNIDFDNNKLKVTKQLGRLKDYSEGAKAKTKLFLRNETKTVRSTRQIYIAPVIMDKLKEYKLQQEVESKQWGKAYHNLNMVFCREDGQFIDPATFRDFYLRTLKQAGVGHKTFHALRHTFATRALESNANIKTVSEILGHASIQITLDTYSHVSEELQQDTMQKIADNFFIDKVEA